MQSKKSGTLIANEPRPGLILDTHIWIWTNMGSAELSKDSIAVIDKAARKGLVYIPAIVVWEVAMLAKKGRITFKMPIKQWIEEALSKEGINLIPLLPSIAIESAHLPGELHSDPADRLIVASARVNGLKVMTRDAKILEYGAKGYVQVIRA